jgi:hypothetical protein
MWGSRTKKCFNLIGQQKLLLLLASLSLVMLLCSWPAGTQAQGTPSPTPTNIGEGGGNGGDDDDDDGGGAAAPARGPGASLTGFVYGYSDRAFVGGVIVLFESPGWQAETVTDSNGFYQFSGLDSGPAVLNLRLPPGATSVTKDWPVRLVGGQETQANLGFYWGDNPPIPVRLSAEAAGSGRLAVQIENQTGEAATGGLIQIEPLSGVKVSLPVDISQGQVVDYSAYDFQVDLAELEAGETASITASLDPTQGNIEAGQGEGQVRVVFTYDQQITPQVVEVDLSASDFELPVAEAGAAQGAQGAATGQEPAQAFAPPAQSQAQPQAPPAAQDTPVAAAATPAAPSVSEPQAEAQATTQAQAETGQPLPTTGIQQQQPTSWITPLLAGLLVLGLSWVGWKSLKNSPAEG